MDALKLSVRIHEAYLSTPKLLYFLLTKERKQKKMHKQAQKTILNNMQLSTFLRITDALGLRFSLVLG